MARWSYNLTAALILGAIVCAAILCRVNIIETSLPFPRHVDEPKIMARAAHVLTSGNPLPGNYQYPTLPLYLAVASLAASGSDPGWCDYPAYSSTSHARQAKLAWCGLSLLALGAAAWTAYRLAGLYAACVTASVLTLSRFVTYESAEYVNVDIAGAAFVLLAVACLQKSNKPSVLAVSFLQAASVGALVGCAAACKYTLGVWIMAPALLLGWRRWPALGLGAVLTFAACVPGAWLEPVTFARDVAYESAHYRTGHVGHEASPGLGHAWLYLREIGADMGPGVALAAVLGALTVGRRGLALLPAAVLWVYLSGMVVHFQRNLLTGYFVVAILAGVGVARVGRMRVRAALAAALIATMPLGPWWHYVSRPPDTRTRAVTFAEAHPGAEIWPVYGADPRFPGGELVHALNAETRAAIADTLLHLPGNPWLINYQHPAPWGDPELIVGIRRGPR